MKSFLKEDFTPAHVRKVYFWLAPAIVMIPSLLTVAIIPFGSRLGSQKMVIADLNIGVLYTFAIVSLGVYGIVLAGYAANSKYPFLGGIRSSAQMISYEIAMGLSVVPIFLLVGSLEPGGGRRLPVRQHFHWLIFRQPLAFVIFLAAMFAEMNRLPFDLPGIGAGAGRRLQCRVQLDEICLVLHGRIRGHDRWVRADGDLVSRWLDAADRRVRSAGHRIADAELLHIGIFLGKLLFVEFMVIWVRWMWPRFRYDQLMDLGWRRFIPLALANIMVTAVVCGSWLAVRSCWS